MGITTETKSVRSYQGEALEGVRNAFRNGDRRTVIQLATGCGKSIIAGEAARLGRGRFLILSQRRSLVSQLAKSIENWTGEPVAIEMGKNRGLTRAEDSPRIVSASVASISNRLDEIAADYFDVIFVDEAHHAPSPTHRAVLDHFERARVVGMTATPDRYDGVGLHTVFDSMSFRYALRDAIADGWLAPIRSFVVQMSANFEGVRKRAGELATDDVEALMMTDLTLAEVARPVIENIGDRLGIIFTVSVAHAHAIERVLCELSGDPNFARAVDGTFSDDKRDAILADVEAKRVRCLVNVGVFTEGFDLPALSLIGMARPTCSRALYEQCIGRGVRLAPGKSDALVLDFVPSNCRHRLAGSLALIGDELPDDVIAIAEELAIEREEAMAPEALIDLAQQERQARREDVLYSLAPRDAFAAIGVDLEDHRVAGLSERPTEAQWECLKRNGMKDAEIAKLSKRSASELIEIIVARGKADLCTLKQAKALARSGFDPKRVTFSQAREALDIIGAAHWRVTTPIVAALAVIGVPRSPAGKVIE